ncbi:hypothetical protein M8009_01385 [Halomonas sp. ATCH28]|uniref:Uncharacterized protein n=1 Tax=Halomonas gemina TaxID=2945105 RepID=A0ABT0SWH0_9GAMM|nr:hypothetical protein [Halomonas gemina]MCL7938957.1 hypothetical protein [Halomonas gemina]
MTRNEKPPPGVTRNGLFLMMFLVGATGFEPATFATKCQIRSRRSVVVSLSSVAGGALAIRLNADGYVINFHALRAVLLNRILARTS